MKCYSNNNSFMLIDKAIKFRNVLLNFIIVIEKSFLYYMYIFYVISLHLTNLLIPSVFLTDFWKTKTCCFNNNFYSQKIGYMLLEPNIFYKLESLHLLSANIMFSNRNNL